MIHAGQIVLFRFPKTDQSAGKLRPALILKKLPGQYDDWLICMISSQLSQEVKGLDDIIRVEDSDYRSSGLKTDSLIRASRLAVVRKAILAGSAGEISSARLSRVKESIANWIENA